MLSLYLSPQDTAYYNDYVAQDVDDVIMLFEKTIADLP